MDGVTDAAFRYVTAKYGHPGVIFTEFTSVEGIRAGATRLLDDFFYDPIERPIVAQLFGADPDAFYVAAIVASALGFDGLDINMGCPSRNITEKGAGASLIQDPERALAIIRQTKAGTKAWSEGTTLQEVGIDLPVRVIGRQELPVSVKTRTGYTQSAVGEWIPRLLEGEPAVITLHGRTLKQLYSGQADWEAVAEAAQIVKQTETKILGNGDVQSPADARERCVRYGVDGALIGRAALGNPWLFQETEADFPERMRVALEQARYLDQIFSGRGFLRMRKHLLEYCRGIEGAKELRATLMKVSSLAELEAVYVSSPYLLN